LEELKHELAAKQFTSNRVAGEVNIARVMKQYRKLYIEVVHFLCIYFKIGLAPCEAPSAGEPEVPDEFKVPDEFEVPDELVAGRCFSAWRAQWTWRRCTEPMPGFGNRAITR